MTTGADPQPEHAAPKPVVNRVLGATSGSADGNVRASLAVLAMLGVHGLVALLVVGYSAQYHEAAGALIGALSTLDVGCVAWYFGKRSSETGG